MKSRLVYIGNALAVHGRAPTSADIVPSLLREEGFQVEVASSRKNVVLRMLDMLWVILRHSRSADYVLIDTYSTKNIWYAFLCSRLCHLLNLKYIAILHGGELPQRMDRSRLMAQAIFGRSFCNVAPSRYLLEALLKRGFQGRLIPNTIPIKQFKLKKRLEFRPKILWVRAFAGLYNPQMALHVLKGISSNYPEARLSMVGPDKDGSWEECRVLARELELECQVEFPGRLSKKDWHALSEDHDIFINTTNKDNTPVSVMEAMALGLPVVSTNPGGMPFLIEHEHDGLLVDVNDVDAMVAKIRLLLSDPSQAISLAEAARSKVEGFDWDQVKRKWRDLLESCD